MYVRHDDTWKFCVPGGCRDVALPSSPVATIASAEPAGTGG